MKRASLWLTGAALASVLCITTSAPAQTSLPAKDATALRAEKLITAALARETTLHFRQKPLNQVVDAISRHAGVNCVLDEKALADQAVAVNVPVSVSLSQVTLRTALATMLRPLQLTWCVRGETLLITTQQEADSRLEIRVYPVQDLVKVYIDGDAHNDFDALIDLISNTVAPTTWDVVGGPGSLGESDAAAALVCSQTTEVHEQVEELLEALRRVRGLQGIETVRRIKSVPAFDELAAAEELVGRGSRAARLERVYVATPGWARPKVHR